MQKLLGGFAGWLLALVPAGISLFLASLIERVATAGPISARLNWVTSYDISFSFLVDGLSLTFALLISGIGALIVWYSGAYLKGHPHQGRFFAFILAFTGSMLGLVLADNMLALYAFWELTTVTSFLLIGFDNSRQAARRAAIQALVVTNIGGLALLLAAILLERVLGSWDISGLTAAAGDARLHAAYPLILVLVLLAGFTKSAQVPFQFWLPNAMEAPTPVSAFLHSATMVQGGVYLFARFSPILGGTTPWMMALTVVGSITLIWGSLAALRQTDLKQVLAQSTIASLGLLVLLIGVGTEAAIAAAVVYFVAHALYKAALFLVVGTIDHETGTRDITGLGGLSRAMPLTFLAALLSAVSMFGLPPTLGYLAKEEIYLALTGGDVAAIVLLAVMIIGNGILAGLALAIVVKVFLGNAATTPKAPHEGSFGLLLGPLVFAAGGVALAFATPWFAASILSPAVAAVVGRDFASHLVFVIDVTAPAFWLSVVTWAVAAAVFYRLDWLRSVLRRAFTASGWSFDRGFDAIMFGLIRFAGAFTRFWHHGKLELYLVVVVAMFAVALLAPVLAHRALPAMPDFPRLTFYEWGLIALAVAGLGTILLARNRLVAIIALGVQGLAVALIFLAFGAPDLAFTQLMVEILSVVILTLVMTRLKLHSGDPREFEDLLRDGTLAVLCGMGVTVLLAVVLATPLDTRLSDFFTEHSQTLAHGRNIVNVILVDFRGLDTLGEIAVVMTAGIAIVALIRSRKARPAAPLATAERPKRRSSRAKRALSGSEPSP